MEYEIENEWCFYVTKQRVTQGHEKHVKEWEDRLSKVHSFKTAEGFWSVFNNFRPVGDMLNDSGDFYMFKDQILPEWEDSMNAGGGRWIVATDSQKVEDMWGLLLMSLIGNMYDDLSEFICGAELAVRPKKRFKIAVWIKQADKKSTVQLGESIKKFLNATKADFQKHKGDKVEYSV
ncbi:hypothetical protein SteCoe_12778 [Stentor coeruleus]|uniref:Eukaryotic translation initiation factor 4E n=1 Tax=Stentor coeruleus TaxID=5963 RepID=A0A1R2C9V3_9CILI|nr:hypothetical protein SteCoe_12778 [Stentor coeruleus]